MIKNKIDENKKIIKNNKKMKEIKKIMEIKNNEIQLMRNIFDEK